MNKVELINIALSHLGVKNISDIDEGSEQSRTASVYYDATRKSVLEKYNWPFAIKKVSLALLDTTPIDYQFAYQLPSDCIKVINIAPQSGSFSEVGNIYPFEIMGKELHCDLEDIYIAYVYDDEDTNTFSDMFIDAFSHLLASRMAIRLVKDRDLQVTELNIYTSMVGEVGASSLGQDKQSKDDNPYITARS